MTTVANEAIPFYEDGERITGSASAAVTGKRFVKISGDIQGALSPGLTTATSGGNVVVALATAAGRVFGVASHDAAIGQKVTVLASPGMVVPVTAVGAISAFGEVEVGATGKATALASGVAVGVVLADAADGEDAMVKLY